MKTPDRNLLGFSRYAGGLDGGSLRHQQVIELAEKGGFRVILNPGFSPRFRAQLLPSFLAGLRIVFASPLRHKHILVRASTRGGPANLLVVGRHFHGVRGWAKDHQAGAIVVEDVIFGGQGAVLAARELGIPAIALPHNLDALTGRVPSVSQGCACLAAEMEGLRLADATFAISESDAWLHRQFGIASVVLSYYPTAAKERELRTIRALRPSKSKDRRFLIAGNAHNLPTREGMAELLQFIGSRKWPSGLFFDVIGRDTQCLGAANLCPQVVFHGGVDSNAFRDLSSTCEACLVYQKRGSGSLTRVMDLALAGVPVLGSPVAMRDWEHLEGVATFRDWNELLQLLSGPMAIPTPPARPTHQEECFLEALRRTLHTPIRT